MSLSPQPSTTDSQPLTAARAKQTEARRKMQTLPGQRNTGELPNIDYHAHYLQRVKPLDIVEQALRLTDDELGVRPGESSRPVLILVGAKS